MKKIVLLAVLAGLLAMPANAANDGGGGSSSGYACVPPGLKAVWVGYWHITGIPC